MTDKIMEECAGCAEAVFFATEAERQEAYAEGDTSEVFCESCKADGTDCAKEGDSDD